MADESLNPKDSLTENDYQSKGLLVTGLLLLSLLLITWLLEALGTDLNAARWAFSPTEAVSYTHLTLPTILLV